MRLRIVGAALCVAVTAALCGPTALVSAEGSGAPDGMPRVLAGRLDSGNSHTCAVTDGGRIRCWGMGSGGILGYANTNHIGDNESPSSAGVVNLGPGLTATAVAAGAAHTCALADDSAVRCWGQGFGGRLGYGNTVSIGDDEHPATAGAVPLGRRAVAVTAGGYHTCAILDDGSVRCWGVGSTYFGGGHLGYGNNAQIGDDETPESVGAVDIGAGRRATAITAGENHTCALLDDGTIRCWGSNFFGQLGIPSSQNIGDNETPGSVAPVDLGAGRTASAVSAGRYHTCAILDDGAASCWGDGPDGLVDLGQERRATAIDAGAEHTCAVLDDATVRCWGRARDDGKLGYGNLDDIGDDETPGSAGPVDLGAGRRATAITTGVAHTCAALDDGRIRCWGTNAAGAHGGCGWPWPIGDDETPGQRPPLNLDGMISVAPRAPTDVVAVWVGPGNVELTWTAPDPGSAPISVYTITWVPPGQVKAVRATTTDPSAFLSGLPEGVYRFTVVAANPARSGPPATSNEVTVSDTPPDPPSM